MTLPATTRASTPRPTAAASPPPKPTVASLTATGGAWNRSQTKEVAISDLQQKFGWSDASWQGRLMKAADGAGAKARGRNGSVSASELESYLAAPTDAQFLTSTALQKERAALDAKLKGGAHAADVDAFDTKWQAAVAKRADKLSGNGDGQLTVDELNAFINDSKAGKLKDTQWVPDQKAAVFESRVAEGSGEVDPLRPQATGKSDSGMALIKEYSRASLDQGKNVPTFVSYMLSASDIRETPATVNRSKSTFTRDPVLGSKGVTDSDYNNTGFDRGHMKPAEDSPTQEAMDESHLMTNIAPQYGNHNQQVWRTLEQGVSGLVKATGGKAYILTGNLFLDAKGKPLPPESIETTGSKTRRIGVPTHNFKTVLLELPNGNLTMFAYLVPNTKQGPSKKEDIIPFLESTRVPVDRIEELLGQDLYAELPKAVQTKLEKDSKALGAFQDGSAYQSLTLLKQPAS
ncbi:DNA/RNA non-specific endonuclease [Corallococcus sp. H22C18031201]|uniref:DNA/RNA non-specific endonuclease n=1 Tax=Citreicoccus inhibens TaxID=2849499 RepID=UPI000E7679EA|nr:DNA/RNA non-specific endonuclease [Citreicoccus inhibens]MBU8896927.1 DNA/RNA non-specific endonuclease [Citreicoccus inhibens]RJS20819.1 DNA/RNA non-specific endonuclease [Corallococcus sp. H22C18031201]